MLLLIEPANRYSGFHRTVAMIGKANLISLLTFAATVTAHDGLPINPLLGVPGFPDCVQSHSIRQGKRRNGQGGRVWSKTAIAKVSFLNQDLTRK